MIRIQLSSLASFTLAFGFMLTASPTAWSQTLDAAGLLLVNGTAADDNIEFAIDVDDVVVSRNGAETRFALADVSELEVRTFGGDDTIRNNTDIDMFADAGLGDDFVVGGSGDDHLLGQGGEDSLFGNDGRDVLEGGADEDYLSGGNGNDRLLSESRSTDVVFGGAGDDFIVDGRELYGGPGNDTISTSSDFNSRFVVNVIVSGGPGDDDLFVSRQRGNSVLGGPGNDFIEVRSTFNGSVDGGPGIDIINDNPDSAGAVLRERELVVAGSEADDSLSVTLDAEILRVRIQNSTTDQEQTFLRNEVSTITIHGGDGNDTLSNTSDVRSTLFGGSGNDTLTKEGTENAILCGGTGNDVLTNIRAGVVRLDGDSGDDVLIAEGAGRITMCGDDGDDVMINDGNALVMFFDRDGDDTFMTNNDNDRCLVRGGSDVFLLNGGTVEYEAESSADVITVIGSERNETVVFEGRAFNFNGPLATTSRFHRIDLGPGDDIYDGRENESFFVEVRGGSGNDMLLGGGANNVERLFGGPGDDMIAGGEGAEVIFGDSGDDVLTSGFFPIAPDTDGLAYAATPACLALCRAAPETTFFKATRAMTS